MEAAGGAPLNPSVHEVFLDFKGRRTAIVKALTTDFKDFFQQCDPEKEDLCLYGFPDEVWQVNLPAEEVPAELPEPVLGINFARDGMEKRDWLSFVAAHSDTWLISVAMFFGARFGFDKADRNQLFNMINDLPTVYDVVVGKVKRQGKKKSSASNHDNNKSKSNTKRGFESQRNYSKAMELKDEDDLEEEDEEHGETLCGTCGESDAADVDGFWICCDICERWFHGKCVKITRAKAEYIKHYKCPSCNNKKLPESEPENKTAPTFKTQSQRSGGKRWVQVLKENTAKATQQDIQGFQQLTVGSCGGVAPTRVQVVQFTE